MFGLKTDPNGLKFENINISIFKNIVSTKICSVRENKKKTNIGYFCFNTNENIISSHKVKPNSLFIFDDVVCDRSNVMRECFSMGRHSTCVKNTHISRSI